ncbi:heat-shock protein Hsp20 [Desulfonema ishimotonii]|uniref:Heat-shock protein Hsp20 n=1 Tax=Desulfonema ishimotonii TaxID=45657 RepID=A0A401FZD6_9BACT|nr:Hsp20/alpha crystallin family protein [Desulfonema ishimotonii]GBC62349.1 heat-shock protein Hsp20 [Desulfonema ishimotonii]
MTTQEEKALRAKEKPEFSQTLEPTKPGPAFVPAVDIFETDSGITLIADMPGVKAEDLDIDLREDVLTLSGAVLPPEEPAEQEVFREYNTGTYFRQFSLSEVIDQEKIDAQLRDGILRLTLPKMEKATPRKIKVSAG